MGTTTMERATGKAPRRRLSLSLRGSMLVVLCFGLWLGWRVHLARQQRRDVADIAASGNFVLYDWEYVGGKRVEGGRPRGPGWLRRAIGDEHFQHVVEINMTYGGDPRNRAVETPLEADKLAAILTANPTLRHLHLPGELATDRVMAVVGGLRSLETLKIYGSGVSEAGLANVRGLRNLKILQVREAGLGDDALASLVPLVRLEHLDVGNNPITDAGMIHLKGLKALEFLNIDSTKVTDAGLDELRGLVNLKEVWVPDPIVSDERIGRFYEEMPNLHTIR
jgi:Leucine Rich repeat